MDRMDVGAVELCFEVLGAAGDPVVVLIAGLGRQLIAWDDAFCGRLVAEGFRVVRFDNRDAGLSTVLGGSRPFDAASSAAGPPYTLDDMADDTAGLLDALGTGPAHVVGTSLGGMIGQVLALRHPGLVASLCSIMSTTGAPGVGRPTPEAVTAVLRLFGADPFPGRDEYVAIELDTSRVVGSRGALVDEAWRRGRFERFFDRGLHPAGVQRQAAAVAAAPDRTAPLGTVRVPTLVLHGDADPLVTPDGGEATARAVPGAELLVVPDMGHEIPPATWPVVVGAIAANARRAPADAGAPAGATARRASGGTVR